MKRISRPPEDGSHSIEFKLRWTPGALKALAVAVLTIAGTLAAHWREMATFFGLMTLLMIVFTPVRKSGSPEDVFFFPSTIVGPETFLVCDLSHSRRETGLPCPRSRLSFPPAGDPLWRLAGTVDAVPVFFRV